MTKVTKYARNITQSLPNNNYVKFNNISNLKNNKDTYSKTDKIAKATNSSHRRPAQIHASKFGFNIPAGSRIKSVTVEYAAAFEGNISIASPVVDCTVIDTASKKGKALTKKVTNSTITWKGNRYLSNINAEAFGVTITFASNTKYGEGYVKLKYLRIIIDYTAPKFSISAKKTSGKYTRDHFKVQFTAVNSNKTLGSTNVTISLPSGVSYEGKVSGKGSISVSSSSKLVWKPGLSGKVLSAKIVLQFRIMTDGNHNISMKESSSSRSSKINVKSIARPVGSAVVIPDDSEDEGSSDDGGEDESGNMDEGEPSSIDCIENEWFDMSLSISEEMYALIKTGFVQFYDTNEEYQYPMRFNGTANGDDMPMRYGYYWGEDIQESEDGYVLSFQVKVEKIGKYVLSAYGVEYGSSETFGNGTKIGSIELNCIPSEESLTTPFLTSLAHYSPKL